jgi:hypothetical protein
MTVTVILCLLFATGLPTDTSNRRASLTATQFVTPTLDLTLAPKPAQRPAEKAPALPLPVPVPTPAYDPKSYIRATVGNSITVRAKKGEDLAALINSAQNRNVATVKIAGGGSITNQVRLRRHTVFDSSTYSCDTRGRDQVVSGNTNNSLWYGCFLVDDNVLVEGTWRPPVELEDFFRNPSDVSETAVELEMSSLTTATDQFESQWLPAAVLDDLLQSWCTQQGSNLRPSDPKSDALSN